MISPYSIIYNQSKDRIKHLTRQNTETEKKHFYISSGLSILFGLYFAGITPFGGAS